MPPAALSELSQLDLTRSYSYADYLTWRFTEAVELLRGRVARLSPAPRRIHQDIVGNVFAPLRQHLRGKTCRAYEAPFDVRLPQRPGDPDHQIYTVVQPDVSVICDPAKLDAAGCVGAPDWIVEVLSPGTSARDIGPKFRLYEEHGVGEYWLISPAERNVVVFVLEAGQYQAVGDFTAPGVVPSRTLPDIVLDWTDVFADV